MPTSRATRVTSSANERELVDHRVHGRADAAELAAQRPAVDLQVHLLREVADGDGVDHACDLGRRPGEVVDHPVDRVDGLLPRAARVGNGRALVEAALAVDDARDALNLAGQRRAALGHLVVGARELSGETVLGVGDAELEVAGDGGAQAGEQLAQRRLVDRRRWSRRLTSHARTLRRADGSAAVCSVFAARG